MAGKAPLLLASVLFVVGAAGLARTSLERASWGSFEPRGQQAPELRLAVVDVGPQQVDPPGLFELTTAIPETAIASETPENLAFVPPAAPAATQEPDPAPAPVPPLRVFGISADDGGSVAAAEVTPAPPPPLRMMNVASDDSVADETPTPEGEATPEAVATPERDASPE